MSGIQPNAFYINGKQFDPSCVDETMTLGKAEQWAVQNGSVPAHPFHIHTNPFQIIAMNGKALPAPWIWWDTFGLPAVSTTPQDVNAGPIFSNQQAQQVCPGVCTQANANWNGQWTTTVPNQMSVCGCLPWGSITTRSRFLDFTGEYVVHCHFLGHEDRGMMAYRPSARRPRNGARPCQPAPRTTAASTCRPPRSARTEDGASQVVVPFRMTSGISIVLPLLRSEAWRTAVASATF